MVDVNGVARCDRYLGDRLMPGALLSIAENIFNGMGKDVCNRPAVAEVTPLGPDPDNLDPMHYCEGHLPVALAEGRKLLKRLDKPNKEVKPNGK